MDKWVFYITHGAFTHQVYPLGFNECNFEDQQEPNQIFYRRKLSGKLKFINDITKGITDYDYLKALFDVNYCDEISLLIRRVDGTINDWNGVFRLRNGRWDWDRCTYETEVQPNDIYSCILNNWETKLNVLTVAKTYINRDQDTKYEYDECSIRHTFPAGDPYVSQFLGNIAIMQSLVVNGLMTDFECVAGIPNYVHPCPESYNMCQANSHDYIYPNEWDAGGWQLDFAEWSYVSGSAMTGLTVDITIRWIRIVEVTFDVGGSPVVPPGSWDTNEVVTLMGQPAHKYARHAYTSMLLNTDWTWVYDATHASCTHIQLVPTTYTYNGARKLSEVADFLLINTCNTYGQIISDFFQWHPLTATITNYVTGLPSRINDLWILQMSDWQLPMPSNPATLGNMTLRELLDFMRIAFNAYWYIDSAGRFRLEHISYITYSVVWNLTTPALIQYIKAKNKFEYQESPKNERWEFAEQYGVDFTGMQLIYECFKSTDEILYADSVFRTDPSSVRIEGFIMVALDGAYKLINEVGALTGYTNSNGNLSIANLMRDYHTYNRLLPTGYLNNILTTFTTIKKMRQQDEISVPYCAEIDPKGLITTELGDGQIKLIQYSPKTESVKITLLHD